MSCINSNSPINISNTDNILNCSGKCDFKYNFLLSNIICTNRTNYLSIELSKKDKTMVDYSTNSSSGSCTLEGGKLNVNELRIYTPSLHKYNNVRAEAELIIDLKNTMGGNDILLCIPISNTSGTLPEASTQLNQIIDLMSSIGNTPNQGGNIPGLELNLNQFISNKGFYTYNGTMPYSPCNNCTIFIVYHLDNTSININDTILNKLQNIIQTSNFPIKQVKEEQGLAFNKSGAKRNAGSSDDNIWIDCQPTGQSGKTLVTTEKNDNYNNYNDYLKNLFNGNVGKVILGLILVFLFFVIYHSFIKVIKVLQVKAGNELSQPGTKG